LKKHAKRSGSDLVGITSMDRFEGAPKHQDPRYIHLEQAGRLTKQFSSSFRKRKP